MVFSSVLFLFFFFPVTILGYYLLPEKAKNYWLLILSLIFFAWLQPQYLWVVLVNIMINYFGAILILRFRERKKLILILTLSLNLLLLIFFKYLDFLLGIFNHVTGSNLPLLNILLPIGISFFTFQGMSYVIDVYREQVPVQKNIFKTGLFIVLFPQLIAGPIVRYKEIAGEIEHRWVNLDEFRNGTERFLIGLAKKVILANSLAVTADAVWISGAGESTWMVSWIGSIAYTLQIYFDFSGYSDMAIGLGKMFGFHFPENFRLPYVSKTITEFWRRWHISLSSWFKDYVYIPLGGNKKHVYLNLLIVFLLTGIWHGAAWNFIVWGLWNFLFVLMERLIRTRTKRKGPLVLSAVTKLYTLFIVNLGWVFFRAPDLKAAARFILSMFGIGNTDQPGFTAGWYLDGFTILVFAAAILAASSLPERAGRLLKKKLPETLLLVVKDAALLLLFAFSIMRIISGNYNPFIYFRF